MKTSPTIRPRVDVYRSDEAMLLIAELPGVTAEDVSLQIEGAALTLDAVWSPEVPGRALSQGFAPTRYRRRFELPRAADVAAVTAEHRDGTLRVLVPWRSEARARQIPVA